MMPTTAPSLSACIVAVVVTAGLGSCTIAKMQKEEQAEEEAVRQEQVAVQAEQARSDTLARQQDQLKTDLAQRQLSLQELNTRVAQLQAENARESASNDQIRQQRERSIEKVRNTGTQLVQLQQAPDSSSAQKQAQIDFLKREIQDQLDLLLH